MSRTAISHRVSADEKHSEPTAFGRLPRMTAISRRGGMISRHGSRLEFPKARGDPLVWDEIRKVGPDAFIFAGDNVYTDTGPNRLRSAPERIGSSYDSLVSNPSFQSFRKQIPIDSKPSL
jgi:hypothetical protein